MLEGVAVREKPLREGTVDHGNVSCVAVFRSGPHTPLQQRNMQRRKIFGTYKMDVCRLRFAQGLPQNFKPSIPSAAGRVGKDRDGGGGHAGCFRDLGAELFKIRRPGGPSRVRIVAKWNL